MKGPLSWLFAASGSVELRWEIFNLLNHANFDLPNRIFGNPGFGRIFSAKSPREMQLGLRVALAEAGWPVTARFQSLSSRAAARAADGRRPRR